MERQIRSLRTGCYIAPGVELHIIAGEDGTIVRAIVKDGLSIGWLFSEEGVFQALEAQSAGKPRLQIEGNIVYTCPHVTPAYDGDILFQLEGTVPVVCCLQCIGVAGYNGFIPSDEVVHAMDRELLDRLLCHCHLIDLDKGVVQCPNRS